MNYIQRITEFEEQRQQNTLNLIASENYPSPKTINFLGSLWSNKYGEGYPGKRYYAGNVYTDDLESFVKQKALEIFDKTGEYGVNIQVLSGTPANAMVFLSILNYGDTVLSLNVNNGGHISHMHPTSRWLKFFKLVNYDLKEEQPGIWEMDLEDFKKKIIDHKPRLVIIGCSAYPRKYEFSKMCKFAHDQGCLVLADIAHINGLVATGLHDTPFNKGGEGADFVSMTTHKTFRGPRGAMVFAKNYLPEYAKLSESELRVTPKRQATSLIEVLDRTIFPGNSGGPHFNKIAAIGQACLEILGQDSYPDNVSFLEYSQNTLKNTAALEKGFVENGLEIVSPTQNHLCLIKLPESTDSLEIQKSLEEIGVITNRNSIPFDTGTPWKPRGVRFGMAALTSRGLSQDLAYTLGSEIADFIIKKQTFKIDKYLKDLKWYY
jgi:glycine hydroxymethyltransferase